MGGESVHEKKGSNEEVSPFAVEFHAVYWRSGRHLTTKGDLFGKLKQMSLGWGWTLRSLPQNSRF